MILHLLGPLEFGALSLLVRNHGILVGHSELEKLWGPGGVSPKSVIQLIRILRMKLEDLGLPDAIHSAYGNGYFFGPKNHVVTTTRSEMLVFKAGGLVLDAESRTAMRGARRITLDPATNGCLKVLMETPEETVSRKRLERASAVPGQHRPGREVLDNTIKRLRYKLGEPQIVHNVRGAGYILRTKD